jgi:UDP-N-acetylmuramoylalanine--D-glutamate ligase
MKDLGFEGKRVTVMGLGSRGGGVGMARFLAKHGAIVTVTDGKPAQELARPLQELAGYPIRYVLGGHEERDFTPEGADFIVRNPAVRRSSAYLLLAAAEGVPIEMEMSLFVRHCPAPVLGITGTKGKTTTAALCAMMLRQWNPATVLAGNMGVSAVDQLDTIQPDTPVVLEISSWQLESLLDHRLAPDIAVLTNISEDHLDSYPDYQSYAEVKRGIARYQTEHDIFIANRNDPEVWCATERVRSRVVPFGTHAGAGEGVWLNGSRIERVTGAGTTEFTIPQTTTYLGGHSRLNAAAAVAAAAAAGAGDEAIQQGLNLFQGVPNRMETVAVIDGVEFINDTAATAPAAVLAALDALNGRTIHIIAGGSDKRIDLTSLAAAFVNVASSIQLLTGSATATIQRLLAEQGVEPPAPVDSMRQAVANAAAHASAGDAVLLSPGCASFGLFRDEFDRGDQFRAAVAELELAREQP